MTTYYLAGPMSGLPQFNMPEFDGAADKLRANGYAVISPAELDSPEMRAQAMASPDGKMPEGGRLAGESWADVLARDVKVIAEQVDGVIFLPNWYLSRGARLEAFVALMTGKKLFANYVGNLIEFTSESDPSALIVPMDREVVRQIIRQNMP